MSAEGNHFELPAKIEAFLAALNRFYGKRKEILLQQIIVNGVLTIQEEWTYDNWNGGTSGHAITLTLPEEMFLEILDKKHALCTRICADINTLHSVQNEHIAAVFLEMEAKGTDHWREESGLLHPRRNVLPSPPAAISRIWGSGHIRLFFSHKAEYKQQASQLKAALERYGIACFVAHQDIHPTEEWQREIEYALGTMDALVALLTPDFHESDWTDQEIGTALGCGVPVIAVRLGLDPYGFIGKRQALVHCSWEDIDSMAAHIYSVLRKRLPDQSRLFEAAVAAYAGSKSLADSEWKVKNVLAGFEKVDSAQAEKVAAAYSANGNNYLASSARSVLLALLERWTGQKWVAHGPRLAKSQSDESVNVEDDIPF